MTTQEVLKEDLLTLEPKAFYLKHIVKSHNWYFSEYLHVPSNEIIDQMDFFKEIVSTNLGINFHSMQIVGSAKIGYSLSPKKVLQPFHKHRLTRAHREKQLKMSCQALHNAPPNRT